MATVIIALASILGLIVSEKTVNLISSTGLVALWAVLCSLAEEKKSNLWMVAVLFVSAFAIHLLDNMDWWWLVAAWAIYVAAWAIYIAVANICESSINFWVTIFLIVAHVGYYWESRFLMVVAPIGAFIILSILVDVKKKK